MQSKAPGKAKKAKSKGKVPAPAKKPVELGDEELDDVSGGTGFNTAGYTSLQDNTLQDNTLQNTLTNTSLWTFKK